MLSQIHYELLQPSRIMLKHIFEGGSAHHVPLDLYHKINNEMGLMPLDRNCNACNMELCKNLFQLMLNYEKDNGATIRN